MQPRLPCLLLFNLYLSFLHSPRLRPPFRVASLLVVFNPPASRIFPLGSSTLNFVCFRFGFRVRDFQLFSLSSQHYSLSNKYSNVLTLPKKFLRICRLCHVVPLAAVHQLNAYIVTDSRKFSYDRS